LNFHFPGSEDALLEGPCVPVGGDWLTHVRLETAKTLRILAPTVDERFEHLTPVVGEMWHNKRDFLEVL
jgi:hypothetical protein